MASAGRMDALRFYAQRLAERLWVKPLIISLLSVLGVFAAVGIGGWLPDAELFTVREDVLDSLLTIMASSMLMIATLALSSMVAAYGSASRDASPRAFSLVLADDLSQRALSTFIGAFIFSIVALIALKSELYDARGYFVLFIFTLLVFALVIVTFVSWVDRIARLGLLSNTVEKVENATAQALQRRRTSPCLGARPLSEVRHEAQEGHALVADKVGYLQRIDVAGLNALAKPMKAEIQVQVLPGTFVHPGRTLAYLCPPAPTTLADDLLQDLREAFVVGKERTFDDDPRYGLVVLAQVADRALSPGVNDPGSAIDILGCQLRLLHAWQAPLSSDEVTCMEEMNLCQHVFVPELEAADLLEDAFAAIARDGAAFVEVERRLQTVLTALIESGDTSMAEAGRAQALRALTLAMQGLSVEEDRQRVLACAPAELRASFVVPAK